MENPLKSSLTSKMTRRYKKKDTAKNIMSNGKSVENVMTETK